MSTLSVYEKKIRGRATEEGARYRVRVTDRTKLNEPDESTWSRVEGVSPFTYASGFGYRCLSIVIKLLVTLYKLAREKMREQVQED